MRYVAPTMRSYRSDVLDDRATNQVSHGAPPPLVRSGLGYLVTTNDVQELRSSLIKGRLPADFEAKLARLGEGNLVERYVEHNCSLFFELLLASMRGSFSGASTSDRERLLRVLAYVRKDEDAIPDYLSGGFFDDQQEVRAAATELGSLLQKYRTWRLRHQVPGMWRIEGWKPSSCRPEAAA
jgi:hypothetical protein